MRKNPFARYLLPAMLILLYAHVPARAETPIESSVETRFQLDLAVPDAAIKGFLPAGWSMNIATSGGATDCNVRVIFVDRLTVNSPDGKPVGQGSQRYVYMELPVKDAKGDAARLVIGGIAESTSDAPGPYGNFLPASAHSMQRSVTGGSGTTSGQVIETQDWTFRAASGEFVVMHIQFERSVSPRAPIADTKFVSAKDPSIVLISRQEQVLDIKRNATTKPTDRVKEFSLQIGGGSWARIFDGSQKMLSWDHILWISRTVLKP